MTILNLTAAELEQVKRACLLCGLLGHPLDGDCSEAAERRLRESILGKLGATGDDSIFCSWHSEECKCGGCTQVRNERLGLAGGACVGGDD